MRNSFEKQLGGTVISTYYVFYKWRYCHVMVHNRKKSIWVPAFTNCYYKLVYLDVSDVEIKGKPAFLECRHFIPKLLNVLAKNTGLIYSSDYSYKVKIIFKYLL